MAAAASVAVNTPAIIGHMLRPADTHSVGHWPRQDSGARARAAPLCRAARCRSFRVTSSASRQHNGGKHPAAASRAAARAHREAMIHATPHHPRRRRALPLLSRQAWPPALAQAPWPARSLRLIIPWPPGQSTDVQGRLIAAWLSERLGQTVVPENRPGAGGQIGTNAVAKAAPDGYTILSASIGPITFSPLVQRTPYDVERELAPVVSLRAGALHAAGEAGFPGAGPAQLPRAGAGQSGQVQPQLLRRRRGAAPADRAVQRQGRAGRAARALPGQRAGAGGAARRPGGLRHRHAGRGLAAGAGWASCGRSASAPPGPRRWCPACMPIATSGGPPDYDIGGWNGIMVPAGTPQPIIDRLVDEIRAGLATPALRRQFELVGVEVAAEGAGGVHGHAARPLGQLRAADPAARHPAE